MVLFKGKQTAPRWFHRHRGTTKELQKAACELKMIIIEQSLGLVGPKTDHDWSTNLPESPPTDLLSEMRV